MSVNKPVMGADFDEKICSQISPAGPSLVDKNAFDVIYSFESSVKQSLPFDDL